MVRWNEEDTVIDNNTSIEVVQAPQNVEARKLFHFAKMNAWDDLIGCLPSYSEDTIRHACDEAAGDEKASLLHVVLSSDSVPVHVIRAILDSTGNPASMVSETNVLKQTPLHTAVHFIPERADIIECLVRVAPAIIGYRDHLNLRPIDILLQKIIMTEEVVKYVNNTGVALLDELWETASILARYANSKKSQPQFQPTLHSCLRIFDFPFALKERALKRYYQQLTVVDATGDLPLHVIARQTPPAEGGVDEDYELDFLNRVLTLCPAAAAQWNNEHHTPLYVAIKSGRKWSSGVRRLLDANPAAIGNVQLPRALFPYLLARLKPSTLYGVIVAQPELLR
ncbi:unnamed protein product [Cylindrotheca closterium]|uniref:Uncharacterized protein n=1 Tax=Cylindrotheca closterium TaxID=2856 RepID=A0AAD2CAJ1_9STRA|nr:unnamed protein product [Cylindrotheca closterium]